MKTQIVRLMIAATREASRLFPTPSVITGEEVRGIEQLCESCYYHLGIVDNPYTEDDLRWQVWDQQAQEITHRVKAEVTGLKEDETRLIQWNGEFVHV